MRPLWVPEGIKRGFERLIARLPASHVSTAASVFCYHSVHPNSPYASVSPSLFEEHLRWFRDNCNVVPLRELMRRVHTPAPKPVVAITFDDGFADNFHYALPLLEAFQLPATFFVTTGLIDGQPEIRERFGILCEVASDRVESLTWQQLSDMLAAGMEIGAHSYSHPNLTLLDEDDAVAEIAGVKRLLEDRLKIPIHSFAYPFGKPRVHVSPAVRRLVQEAGFTTATTIVFRRVRETDDELMLPRFAVNQDPVHLLEAKVSGKLDLLGRWQEEGPVWWGRHVSNDRSRLLRTTHVPPPAAGIERHDART